MIIGHLPAGYLAAVAVALRFPSRAVFAGIVVGAVLPDVDMLWFWLIDSSTHHHHLITHRPVIWISLFVFALALRSPALIGVATGALLHMLLDTTLGHIAWAWPLSDHTITLIEVQPTHDHWIKSFMAHWTFRLEIALLAIALLTFWARRKA